MCILPRSWRALRALSAPWRCCALLLLTAAALRTAGGASCVVRCIMRHAHSLKRAHLAQPREAHGAVGAAGRQAGGASCVVHCIMRHAHSQEGAPCPATRSTRRRRSRWSPGWRCIMCRTLHHAACAFSRGRTLPSHEKHTAPSEPLVARLAVARKMAAARGWQRRRRVTKL
jgi:hypothetical protein